MTKGRTKTEIGPTCQLVAVIPKQIESYSENLYLHLYLRGCGLYFRLGVSGFALRSLVLLEFIFDK